MTIVPVADRSRVAADGGDDPARVETARVEQHEHTAGDGIGADVADALVAGQALLYSGREGSSAAKLVDTQAHAPPDTDGHG